MEPEPGSGSRSTSKIGESSEGGSTSNNDSRGVDGDREALQTSDAITEQADHTRVTSDATAESQTTGAHEDLGNSEDLDHSSKQGGGCLVQPVENVALSSETNDLCECPAGDLSGLGGIPVASTLPDDWTMVEDAKTDAETVGKGEASSHMEIDSGISMEVNSCPSPREDNSVVRSGDSPRAKDLKDDCPVVAKGSEAEGTSAAANERKDAQATEKGAEAMREGSGKSSAPTRLGSRRTRVAEKSVPDSVVSEAQAQAVKLSRHSKSVKETRNDSNQPNTRTSRSNSLGKILSWSRDKPKGSNSPKEASGSEEAPSVSVSPREVDVSSEASKTMAFSESQEEINVSQEDAIMVSASAAQEESSEISKARSAVLTSKTKKEVDLSLELTRTESSSDNLEGSTSPRAASEVLGSEAQERSNVASEAPTSAPTSGAEIASLSEEDSSVLSSSVGQKDVDSISESTKEKVSVSNAEASRRLLNSEVSTGVGISADSSSRVPSSEAGREMGDSLETSSMVPNPEVPRDVGRITDSPRPLATSDAERETGESLETPNMVSNPELSKDVGRITDSSRPLPTSDAENEDSVSNSELSNIVLSPQVSQGVGRTDSSSRVPTPDEEREIGESSETSNIVRNPEVQKEDGMGADASSRASEAVEEFPASSEAPRPVSTFEAQKDLDTSREETISRAEVPSSGSAPEGLQRKPSQISVAEGNARRSDYSLTSTPASRFEEELAEKDKIIDELSRKVVRMEARSIRAKDEFQGLEQNFSHLFNEFELLGRNYELLLRDHKELEGNYKELQGNHKELQGIYKELQGNFKELDRDYEQLQRDYQRLSIEHSETKGQCIQNYETAQSYARSYKKLKENGGRQIGEKENEITDLRGQLEQVKKECGTLQDQMSIYEQQHANEQSRGGSYLDDTKAATPALLVSAMNGVKDASNNFVKVLKSAIHPGIDAAQLEDYIGAVSRNGHVKFQYQAYICRLLFRDFERPHASSSKDALPPTTYFRQYQLHDLKKTDTVERLLRNDRDIDGSLHEFCFDKFVKLLQDIGGLLTNRSIDLMQLVRNKQHPRDSKLYVSFCKLAVSVWLLQRLAFSFLHPAKPFTAERGKPFDLSRMQSVVPLDEPGADEEVQLRVGFYVLPGFDVGNSAIPCEVYVT